MLPLLLPPSSLPVLGLWPLQKHAFFLPLVTFSGAAGNQQNCPIFFSLRMVGGESRTFFSVSALRPLSDVDNRRGPCGLPYPKKEGGLLPFRPHSVLRCRCCISVVVVLSPYLPFPSQKGERAHRTHQRSHCLQQKRGKRVRRNRLECSALPPRYNGGGEKVPLLTSTITDKEGEWLPL